VKIGHEFELVYYPVRSDFTASFNRFSDADVTTTVSRRDRTATYWYETTTYINRNFIAKSTNLGSWSMGIHHFYDSQAGMLFKGDGEKIMFRDKGNILQTVVGDGKKARADCQACGEGLEGDKVSLNAPTTLASGPDGSVYFGDNNFIRRLWPDGKVTTVVELR
jgi:hypothetical protein